MGERAWLGLGSNLGDRLALLQAATDRLGAVSGIRVEASSRVWETDPVGGPPQPQYLNAVLRVDTDLDPHDLLRACLAVEEDLGRERTVRWGPRTVDIDVLLFGDRAVDDPPELVVPHPRMLERGFVLFPLLELDPDPVLPGGTRIRDIRLSLDAGGVSPAFSPLRVGVS